MLLPFHFAITGGLRRWWFLMFAVLLMGCSPTYDWRELPAAGGTVQVAFPGRPSTDSRELPMAGQVVSFEVSAVQAAGATFAVGHMWLSPEDLQNSQQPDLSEEQIIDALVQSLVRSFEPQEVSTSQVAVRRLRPAGNSTVEAVEVLAEQTDGLRLLARVFHHNGQWIQVVALGPVHKLDAETARWFVQSVRLY